MSNPLSQDEEYAKHFKMMAEYWELVSQQTYQDWATMKFIKKTNGGPGHRSKKEFEKYKRFVYENHKLFERRAGMCKAVERSLRDDSDGFDFGSFEPDSGIKKAGKIILGSFSRLKP